MPRNFLVAAAVVTLYLGGAAESAETQSRLRLPYRPEEAGPVYEGRIQDVRPAWGLLVVVVGAGREAREVRFDIREARIVGPSGSEWKGQDLLRGDRVRVRLVAGGRLVQQVSVRPEAERPVLRR